MARKPYPIFPDIIDNIPLDIRKGWLSVVVPKRKINLISDPSFEAFNGSSYNGLWSSFGLATLEVVATDQTSGARGAKVTPTEPDTGSIGLAVSMSSGVYYSLSFDFKTDDPDSVYRAFVTAAGSPDPADSLASVIIPSTSKWRRTSLSFTSQATSYTVFIARYQGTSVTKAFYVDSVQLEEGEVSTYFDGDTRPLSVGRPQAELNQPQFYWTGVPHKSASIRTEYTRSGGAMISFRDFGWITKGIIGLGMASVLAIGSPYGLRGGSEYSRATPQERDFTVVGRVCGDTMEHFSQNKIDLQEAISPFALHRNQPIVLQYQPTDDNDKPLGRPIAIPCVYTGGASGNIVNTYQEEMTLNFKSFFPYVMVAQTQEGDSVNPYTTLEGFVYRRTIYGEWQDITANIVATSRVGRVRYGPDGSIYILQQPSYPTITPGRILRLAPGASTWFTVYTTTGGSTSIADFVITANWKLAISLTSGTAPNLLLFYDILAGTTTSTSPSGGVMNGSTAIAAAPNGDIWMTRVNASVQEEIWQYSIATGTWTKWGTATTSDPINDILVTRSGRVFVTGGFTAITNIDATTTPAQKVSYLPIDANIFTWQEMESGLDDDPDSPGVPTFGSALAEGTDGLVYVGGSFWGTGDSFPDTKPLSNIARWNGLAFGAMDTGTNDTVREIFVAPDNTVYAFGDFTTAGSIEVTRAAAWRDGMWRTWVVLPTYTAGPKFDNMDMANSGELVLVNNSSADSKAPGYTAVENTGTAESRPVFRIRGAGTIYHIVNHTSQNDVYFGSGLYVYANEVLTLDFSGLRPKFTSTTRGDMSWAISPNSRLGNWRVLPGINHVESFMIPDGSSVPQIETYWDKTHLSVEAVVRE